METNYFEKLDLLITNLELDNCHRVQASKELHTPEYREAVEEEIKLLKKKQMIFSALDM